MKVASLFSGVGGLDWGFHVNQYFEIVFANDFDHWACETYRANFTKSNEYLKEGDITAFVESIPDHDLLLGGFPCQAFSLAGKRMGFEDTAIDPKTQQPLKRGLQYQNCITVLLKNKPKFFIFENVKGILSHCKGEIKSKDVIVNDFVQCGYKVHVKLIKMTDYGVPQRRERVLFLGVRKDVELEPESLIPDVLEKVPSLLLKDNLPFPKLTNESEEINNHNYHFGTNIKLSWIIILREGENLKDLSQEEIDTRRLVCGLSPRNKPKSLLGYRRLDGNSIAPTMMFGNTCLPIHPTEDRSISVREAAYLQGFPDIFQFKGGIAAQYKQVGNAVPPKFSVQLADHIENITKSLKAKAY